MGSAQKDSSSLVSHFSHPHRLEHTTAPSTKNIRCFGCKLRVTQGEDYYKCKTCTFSLHHVCYSMPLITNHPSHPKHDLVLLVIPSSPATKTTLINCMACRNNHVTGFCYHCAECNIFFHALCITLPLSLSITNHSHKIKLEFSPPYDFFCDLCNKTSYNNGWLYRCSMCEFDIHIACAVENMQTNPSLAQSNSNPLLRQQQHIISDGVIFSESILEEKTPLRDKMTPLSDDHSTSSTPTPPSSSYQFSDSYFSIDLTKSYSTHERRSQVRKEVSSDYITRRVMSSNSSTLAEEEPIGVVNWWLNNHSHCQNKVSASIFSKGGSTSDFEESSQKVIMKDPSKESLAKWSVKDQRITKSESERNSRSGWRKLLTCCL